MGAFTFTTVARPDRGGRGAVHRRRCLRPGPDASLYPRLPAGRRGSPGRGTAAHSLEPVPARTLIARWDPDGGRTRHPPPGRGRDRVPGFENAEVPPADLFQGRRRRAASQSCRRRRRGGATGDRRCRPILRVEAAWAAGLDEARPAPAGSAAVVAAAADAHRYDVADLAVRAQGGGTPSSRSRHLREHVRSLETAGLGAVPGDFTPRRPARTGRLRPDGAGHRAIRDRSGAPVGNGRPRRPRRSPTAHAPCWPEPDPALLPYAFGRRAAQAFERARPPRPAGSRSSNRGSRPAAPLGPAPALYLLTAV